MLAMSWNVRCLGKAEKRRKVRDVVLSQNPAILFIQESKLDVFDSRVIRNLGGVVLTRGVGVEAVGSAGGLITMWNEDLVSIKDCISNKWCIILVVVLKKLDKDVVLCNVNASNLESERRELWSFICSAQQFFSAPWCIGEDFNTILNESERKKDSFNTWSVKSFNDFILQAKVVDIPLCGAAFTWSNNREDGSWTRLDRFLVCPNILSWFPNVVQRGLPRTISDHCAISLGTIKENWGPSPFKFNNEWLEDKELMAVVQKAWVDSNVTRSSIYILHTKLRSSKCKIKGWALAKMRDKASTKSIEDRLAKIDERAASGCWTEPLRQERLEANVELWKLLRLEEQEWRQKSRVKWLLEGDRNTRFFHCVASGKKRRNFIENIYFDGVVKSNVDEVRNGVADFFENQYKNVPWCHPKFNGLHVKKLSNEERESLEEKFSMEEVWAAVSSCDGNKGPGPDGFNMNFVKENWKVIKIDFMKFMEEFH
ncbi:hypothetical protein Dsin_005884 [Dipteronia sinensis]|uniref:Endonuclease/exonuclease/phosphatase domain-containing protein n=1 Tax=Dipteronia sinensis TaxID=43782 RepID=A0AAE0AXM6_9ROSI|nr:hypothetical protein Dsin_005884 [Dipteronia sinensis]